MLVAAAVGGPTPPGRSDLDYGEEGGEEHKDWLQECTGQDSLCSPNDVVPEATIPLGVPAIFNSNI